MSINTILTGVLIEETTTFTFIEVCEKYHIPQQLLEEMIVQGLFTCQTTDQEELSLNQKELNRIESAFRLHRDLGVNLPGVAVVLDLLDEMEQMRNELEVLRRHF